MSATQHAIVIEQGADWRDAFQVTETDGTTPTDLTGATIASQLRAFPGGPLIVALPVTITNAVGGLFEIALAAAQTTALLPGVTFVYDIKCTLADGTVFRLAQGSAMVSAQVTV